MSAADPREDFVRSNKSLSTGFLLAALALLPFTISWESIWLDEGDTAMYAIQSSFGNWWHHLAADTNADCQMPLTMLTVWLTAQVFGTGEWALRSQNLVWGLIAVLAFFRVSRRLNLPWLPLLLVVQPFFWFYMDEARPYVAEIALGAVLLGQMLEWSEGLASPGEIRSWLLRFGAATLLLFSISMLCAVTVLGVLLTLIVTTPHRVWETLRSNKGLVLIFGILLGLLSAYYLWTLGKGAAGARIWAVSFKSTAFVFYELLGCVGLGPSLDALRSGASGGSMVALLPQFVAPGLLILLLVVMALRQLRKTGQQANVSHCLAVIIFVSACMIAASVALHKPLWARHFSSILPFFVFLEAIILGRVLKVGGKLEKAAATTLFALLGFSAFQIRCSERFAKDDYRRAAQIANAALQKNRKVWWAAAEYPAQYYRLAVDFDGRSSGAVLVSSRQWPGLSKLEKPDLIVFTRPEVYDPAGKVAALIRSGKYSLTETPKNFLIYARP